MHPRSLMGKCFTLEQECKAGGGVDLEEHLRAVLHPVSLLKGDQGVVVQGALAERVAEHFSQLRLELWGISAFPKEKPPTNG